MGEVLVKTHLIVKETHNEYHIKWLGRILDTKPLFKDGRPIFVIVGGNGRMELNTTDMAKVEKCAKRMTFPRGRSAITTDYARIYIKEENENEKLLGVLTHDHVKTFAPMYDKIEYR